MNSLPKQSYDRTKTYAWNFENAPSPLSESEVPTEIGLKTEFCGLPLNSPLGIAAGPLLNGKWLLHYAQLGFDFLTYKTVRSTVRDCYPLPNLVPIQEAKVQAGQMAHVSDRMDRSWAISFGMPSRAPDFWRQDIEWTKKRLHKGQLLSVSVVASAEPNWNMEEVAEDYARCAKWAAESGADFVELNLSCPNVSSVDGQLYQDFESSKLVVELTRDSVGPNCPIILKIGAFHRESDIQSFLEAIAEHTDAISMTNCLACPVSNHETSLLFDGQPRGIGGSAILEASVTQIACFKKAIDSGKFDVELIGVGGIFEAADVAEYLNSGASIVNLATAVMLDPDVGLKIRRQLQEKLS